MFLNPVVLPTIPWEAVEFLTNVSEIIKIYGPTEIRTRTYCLRIFRLLFTAEIICLKKEIVGKNILKKKQKRPYCTESIIFLTYQNMWRKIVISIFQHWRLNMFIFRENVTVELSVTVGYNAPQWAIYMIYVTIGFILCGD